MFTGVRGGGSKFRCFIAYVLYGWLLCGCKTNKILGFSLFFSTFIKTTLFLLNVPFWSPWEHQKTFVFLMFSGESKRQQCEENGSGKTFSVFAAARKFKSPAKVLVLQRERCLPLDFGRYCFALLRCLHFSFRILCFFQATEVECWDDQSHMPRNCIWLIWLQETWCFSKKEFAIFKEKETFYSVKLNFGHSYIWHICQQTKFSQIFLSGRKLWWCLKIISQ